MAPRTVDRPPIGKDWVHEVKFDGWRVLLYAGLSPRLMTRKGNDITRRFRALMDALRCFKVKDAVLDCELVALNDLGFPDSKALTVEGNNANLCLWCFDLLEINGADLRDLPLTRRRARLRTLIKRCDHGRIRLSHTFEDPELLLEACEKLGVEGVVSKRKNSTYKPGPTRDWVRVKTKAWRNGHRERWPVFEPR